VSRIADDVGEHPKAPTEADPTPPRTPSPRCDALVDDEILPVFEADLDLPRLSAAVISNAAMEERR
jgi:hypothetical protein